MINPESLALVIPFTVITNYLRLRSPSFPQPPLYHTFSKPATLMPLFDSFWLISVKQDRNDSCEFKVINSHYPGPDSTLITRITTGIIPITAIIMGYIPARYTGLISKYKKTAIIIHQLNDQQAFLITRKSAIRPKYP